jgi:CheY-like chemotaxis protein
MKILLVEDDQNKRERIAAHVHEVVPHAEVTTALSYRSAVEQVISNTWDLLLLDMTLPTYDVSENEDGFQTEAFAGTSVFREMKRRNIKIPTVVVTGFETLGEGAERMSLSELQKRLEKDYPGLYQGAIFYAPGDSGWMPQITEKLHLYDPNPGSRR